MDGLWRASPSFYIYSDGGRQGEEHSLPNVEVFHVSQLAVNYNLGNIDHADEHTIVEAGWYWWACFPGCIPDGEPIGPFVTDEDAIADAQEDGRYGEVLS